MGFFKRSKKENEVTTMELNQGRDIIDISQELNCEIVTLAEVAAKVMHKRGLFADVKPSWDEIINWIKRNKDVLKKEIEGLIDGEKK